MQDDGIEIRWHQGGIVLDGKVRDAETERILVAGATARLGGEVDQVTDWLVIDAATAPLADADALAQLIRLGLDGWHLQRRAQEGWLAVPAPGDPLGAEGQALAQRAFGRDSAGAGWWHRNEVTLASQPLPSMRLIHIENREEDLHAHLVEERRARCSPRIRLALRLRRQRRWRLFLPSCHLPAQAHRARRSGRKLIAFNDLHGNLEPPRSITAPAAAGGTVAVPAGGAAYMASAIASLKARNPNNAVVSAGDMIGASPLVSASSSTSRPSRR